MNLDPGLIHEAIALCVGNAERLLGNAELLLEHEGSDGLAYVFWSLAVEEYGKGLILDAEITEGSGQVISINSTTWEDLRKGHTRKFKVGLEAILALKGSHLATELLVYMNATEADQVVHDPIGTGGSVSVGAAMTGLFSDPSAGVEPTVDLRFKLLYVNWDGEQHRWMRPGEAIRGEGIHARWQLGRSDLKLLINALRRQLRDSQQPPRP